MTVIRGGVVASLFGAAGACMAMPTGAQPVADRPVAAVVEIALEAPVGDFVSLDAFTGALGRHLTWQSSPATAVGPLRLQAIRLERGRVTGSSQTDPVAPPGRADRIAVALGAGKWRAFLQECCLSPEDPPMSVRALSGRTHFAAARLEEAIGAVAQRGLLGGPFDLEDPPDLDWGRHVVIVVAASADTPILVRPLLLLLDRR